MLHQTIGGPELHQEVSSHHPSQDSRHIRWLRFSRGMAGYPGQEVLFLWILPCFHSHTEQLNHIDSAHYKKQQNISEWQSNNIILGLLLQPRVQESWRNILKAHPQCNDSGFRWSPAVVKKLQLRLEKSEETANDLALATFTESTYNWTQNAQVESMPVVSFSDQNANIHGNMPIIWPQATPAETLFTPNQSSIYDRRTVNSPFQAQHPAWRSIATNQLCPGMLSTNPTAYQNNSSHNSSQELMMADCRQYHR